MSLLHAMDAQIQKTKPSRKNIAYGAMPTEIQKGIGSEMAK